MRPITLRRRSIHAIERFQSFLESRYVLAAAKKSAKLAVKRALQWGIGENFSSECVQQRCSGPAV
jgi:hypothetical protein